MTGPLLLALSPLLLGVALLLLRRSLYKRHEERILQRLGRAFSIVRNGTARREWLDACCSAPAWGLSTSSHSAGCWRGWAWCCWG
ncbi:hypothetical protein O162_06995 [Pseudomonas putida SJ3]|nr:hypothetical protein O162_06995 [Pseudomonas putida SJ3]